MNRAKIAEMVEEIVTQQLAIESDFYKANMTNGFVDHMGADSLDQVELIMAFEEEFGLEITDEEAEKFDTPEKVIDELAKRIGA